VKLRKSKKRFCCWFNETLSVVIPHTQLLEKQMFNKCRYDSQSFGTPLAKITDYLWRVPVVLAEGLKIRAAELLLDSAGRILAWKWVEESEWQTWIFPEIVKTLDIRIESPDDYIGGCYIIYLDHPNNSWNVTYSKGYDYESYPTLFQAVESLEENLFNQYKVTVEGY
jgi:hypothetical protein